MTQRRLFIGAIALTLAMGGFLIVATSNGTINADSLAAGNYNADNCATPAYAKKNTQCKNVRRIIATTFSDTNGNGTKDEGEEALAGVNLTAKKGGADFIQKASDANGKARFGELIVGSYVVTVVASDEYTVISKNPQNAKVVKGKIAFLTFAVKPTGDGTDPTPSPTATSSTSPTDTPSPRAAGPAYHFVSLPIEANKNYGKDRPDLNPIDGSVLDLSKLPDLTGKANLFKSVLSVAGAKSVRWDAYSLVHGKVAVAGRNKPATAIKGKNTGKNAGNVAENYVVSNCIAADEEQSVSWKNFGFTMKAQNRGQLRVSYRVMDECPTEDMAGGEWTELDLSSKYRLGFTQGEVLNDNNNPTFPGAPTGGRSGSNYLDQISKRFQAQKYKTAINKEGKYFQYKINIKTAAASIHTISLSSAPIGGSTDSTPSPNVSTTPTTTPTSSATPSSGPAGEGKISIQTKKLVVGGKSNTSPSPTTSGGPTLPTGSPKVASPTPSPSSDANTVNPLCYGDQDTEEAANVPLPLIKQTSSNGKLKIEDEQTDENGEWTGLDGAEDNFPADTYQVTFGDFEATTYHLVAFCDPDNNHLIRSQSDPTTKKATFTVKNGQTSRLIALYAERTLPYISMNKYAVPGDIVSGVAQKILRIVYPGQKFNYLIRYTNTGGETAKNVVIRDVIPAEYDVDPNQAEDPDSNLKFAPDPRGGSLVTATIGDVKVGQTGTIQIKVTLKASAFNDTSTDSEGILAPE